MPQRFPRVGFLPMLQVSVLQALLLVGCERPLVAFRLYGEKRTLTFSPILFGEPFTFPPFAKARRMGARAFVVG